LAFSLTQTSSANNLKWDKGLIRGLGWSDDEKLIVIAQNGTVQIYHDLQGDFHPFALGHSAEDNGVVSCKFYPSGFVALLGNNSLVHVSNYTEPRPELLASPPSEQISAWAVISPSKTLSRSVEVLLSIGKTIMTVDASQAEDRMLQNGPFRHIAVSPNGKFIAFYTEDHKVWVITSDFQDRLSEYTSKVKTPPRDLQWCGDNAVVLIWEDELHLLGPAGSATTFFYDNFIHVTPDVDGVRIFSAEECEYLHRVPEECEEVFKLGSTSPAAVLIDALDHLEKRSPKADENIQLIRPNLDEAIYTCVRAAGHEYNQSRQKQLLKAASFGKSVIDLYTDVDEFVDMTTALRVLNAVRNHDIGMPLTYTQYMQLTPERLVQRLLNRGEYLLAIKLSEFLRLSMVNLYVHWARQKVRRSRDDEVTICKDIVDRLGDKPGVSFQDIAKTAFDEGRTKLAIELLEHEPRAGKQVPVLLSLGENTRALDKAIESGDTDLVYHVLLQLKNNLPLATFFRTINSRPMATALVEASAAYQDQELLKDLYYQDDRRVDAANSLLEQALTVQDESTKIDKVKSAARVIQDSKEHLTTFRAISEIPILVKMQEVFETDLQDSFVGLSVNETIFKLIRLGNVKRSQRVQSEFKVGESTYWWIRLRALISRRDWRELEEISKVKKSPIGWEVSLF